MPEVVNRAYNDTIELVKALLSSGSINNGSAIQDILQKTYDKLTEIIKSAKT